MGYMDQLGTPDRGHLTGLHRRGHRPMTKARLVGRLERFPPMARKRAPLVAPSNRVVAHRPSLRRAAVMVMVLYCPCGTVGRHRSPR